MIDSSFYSTISLTYSASLVTHLNCCFSDFITHSIKHRLQHFLNLTDSMEKSPSWKVNSQSASQEIPHHSWNTKVHKSTKAHYWTIPWARWTRFTFWNPISLIHISILHPQSRLVQIVCLEFCRCSIQNSVWAQAILTKIFLSPTR